MLSAFNTYKHRLRRHRSARSAVYYRQVRRYQRILDKSLTNQLLPLNGMSGTYRPQEMTHHSKEDR